MKETIRLLRAPGPANPDHPGNDQIVLLVNGKLTTNFAPEVAKQIAKQLIVLAAQIENDRNPEQTAFDSALLRRLGVRIGLTDNPRIQADAIKEAQWNRDLRRYIKNNTMAIPSNEVVGTPKVVNSSEAK